MSSGGFDQARSVFAGMSPAALSAALSSAQTALVNLQSGQQVVTVSYGEGSGTKHVQYAHASIGALTQLITELQACLGIQRRARRAFGVSF